MIYLLWDRVMANFLETPGYLTWPISKEKPRTWEVLVRPAPPSRESLSHTKGEETAGGGGGLSPLPLPPF